MGKKVKKKARSGQKDKRVSSAPPKTVSQRTAPSNTEATNDKATVVKDRKICPHLEKGVDLDKLSAKLRSSGPFKCEDCREGVNDRRGKSGKAKHGKKKGGGDSKSESKAIWVCLECGHFSCGGVGLPTRPQTHAIRHSKQHHHPLAVQFENPQLRWCFTCSILVPAEKSEDGTENTDVLPDIVKMIKARPSEGPAVDVENVWFGSGSVLSGIKSENSAAVGSDGRGGYLVRGLVNLGNTCFFNSVLQNLLALHCLRDYYGKVDGCVGPLTAALKKLVGEITLDSGLRNLINPKPFFGSICAKAPQFRGYQQQDSHELLRCLLDGLATEESSARKQIKSSEEDKNADPTFVDAIFGGQLSSTVTCLECGHTSIVYEPFLDLSLPVPTKKPPSKKAQSVVRPKKTKLPSRKSGKIRPKLTRDVNPLASQSSMDNANGGKSSCQLQTAAPILEQKVVSLGDSALLLSPDASAIVDDKSLTSDDNPTLQHPEASKGMANAIQPPALSDDFTWLDFLGDDAVSDIDTAASQMNDLNQGSVDKSAAQNDPLQNPLECTGENVLSCLDTASYKDNITHVDHHGQEKLSHAQEVTAQIIGTVDAVQNDIALENNSEPCNQTFSGGLNVGVGSLRNFSEEEAPLLVQDSTVLLLPYKEDISVASTVLKAEGEVSSPAIGYEQDSIDFDGFGDMFNEPEVAESSTMKPSSSDNTAETNEVAGAGFVGNSSESEPDEVDNTDAPASVESCLAYFTKSEFLSKDEHAWLCENCSKVLHEERMRKKLQNPRSENQDHGVEHRESSGLLEVRKSHSLFSERRLVDNGNVKKEALIYDDSCMRHEEKANGMVDCTLESGEEAVLNPVASPVESKKGKVEVAPADPAESSTGDKNFCQLNNNNKDPDDCNAGEPSDTGRPEGNVQDGENLPLSEGGESEESEDQKTDPKMVKVERDATKRILISKAPPILTIHLKRFSQDARGRLSKLNGHVVFNHIIDLKPYMDPRGIESDEYKYRLVGMVEHSGTMKGGHYVAYVRGGKEGVAENEEVDYVWYHASDAYVREASLAEALHSEAYILFYEKI